LLFGATYGFETGLGANREMLVANYRVSGVNELVRDTVGYESGRGNITIPSKIGVGLAYSIDERWLFAADFKHSDWGTFQSFGRNDSLVASSDFRGGIQFVPVPGDNQSNLFQRTQYRMGFRYSNTYLSLDGQQIDEIGITIGLGMPFSSASRAETIRRRGSWPILNLSVELGQRGTTDNNLIKERFININLGITINDKWFIPRRYD
jgi:hypothetical protein